MLELDIIVGKWAIKHIPQFSYDECLEYQKEILEHETPTLAKYLTGEFELPTNSPVNNLYLKQIKEWARTAEFRK